MKHPHRRRTALFLCLLLLLLVGVGWYRTQSWHRQEEQHLAVGLAVLKTGYQATINLFALTTEIYFNEIIKRPAVMELVARGLRYQGEARDLARGELYRLLYPSYAKLKDRGLRHLHFHFPDGTSFLRFHRPEKFGDRLHDVQPTIRLVNTFEKPVHGFEIGKSASAFRYIYPLIDQGVHLGGVDLSIPFKTLRNELAALSPFNEFAYILDRSAAEAALSDQLPLYTESPLHPNFLIEDSGVVLPDSLPPPSSMVSTINRQLRHDHAFQSRLSKKDSFALATRVGKQAYAVSFLRIHDADGREVGYLISYAPDPLLSTMKNDYLLNLLMTLVLLSGLGLLFILLICSRDRLKLEQSNLKAITETMHDGLCVTDAGGKIVLVNPATCNMLGYQMEELVEHQARDSWQCSTVKKKVLAGENFVGRMDFDTAGGDCLPVEVAVSPLTDGNGAITGTVTVFRDISQRLEQEAELQRLATTDPLTGLANRRSFFEKMTQELLRFKRYGGDTAVLMLDLDHFKRVNDQYGHGVGDEVLSQFAALAQRMVRDVDLVGRLGGEEFAVLLPGTSLQGALDSAERLRCTAAERLQSQTCSHIFKTAGGDLTVTVSIGVTLFARLDKSPDAALDRADQALYRAKENGRNRVETLLFSES